MIRYTDKQKDKAVDIKTPATGVAPVVTLTSAASKEIENVAGALPKAELTKNEDIKQ